MVKGINLQGHPQQTCTAGSRIQLLPGTYDVWGAADSYIKVDQSADADVATSGNGYLVRKDETVRVLIPSVSWLSASAEVKIVQTD